MAKSVYCNQNTILTLVSNTSNSAKQNVKLFLVRFSKVMRNMTGKKKSLYLA